MKAIRTANRDLSVGQPIPLDREAQTNEQKKESKEIVRRLKNLTKKAEKGEEGANTASKSIRPEK